MNIPHDYYIKFINNRVYKEVLEFHCKSNFTIHEVTRHYSTLHHIPPSELSKLTGNELKLSVARNPQSESELTIPVLGIDHCLQRNDSCVNFNESHLDLEQLKALLAPLLKKQGSSHKRGYPSGGALYPVEVFCCNMSADHPWPDGASVYHLLGRSRVLEKHVMSGRLENLQNIILPESDVGKPSAALVYFIYLPKALFKYRFRGYRHALMEVGSMYMLIDLRCKELGLGTRPWSAFTDHQVTKALNLNPALFVPACIQLIG